MMEQLVNFIIRPPRADYNPQCDLGKEEFNLKGKLFHRKDIEIKNGKGLLLKCSHYVPRHLPEGAPLPCVIYCHGNSGCRTDAKEAALILLPSNITVFTLDFSGSGLSEGEYVSLGWNEKEDLKTVVNYLRSEGNVSCIGLWGRSMGAVTSLLYGVEDPSIAGMVLDSPFSNLMDLMLELVDTYKFPLPKFTVKFAIQHMRRVIKKKACFDISDLDTIKVAKNSFVPALFGHGDADDFIHPHHSDRIYDSYVGDKNIIKFEGDHNSPRPQFFMDSLTIFFHNVLKPPESVHENHFNPTMHDYFDVDNWDAINDFEYDHDRIMIPSMEPTTRSTEDVVNHVHQRRPMSRTVAPFDVSSEEKPDGLRKNQNNPKFDASSSQMINHEQSSGSAGLFSIDCTTDMPSSFEDEERMLMEAILMSLKDCTTTQTAKDETSSSELSKASTSQNSHSSTSSSNISELRIIDSSSNSTSFPPQQVD